MDIEPESGSDSEDAELEDNLGPAGGGDAKAEDHSVVSASDWNFEELKKEKVPDPESFEILGK